MESIYPYRVLSIVAETGKISKAAELLHLTPSAVSHIIQNVENELGVVCFQRTRTGMKLTENGKRILPQINAIIREQDVLKQSISGILNMQDGVIKIGAFYSVTINWLKDIFNKFHSLYPDIAIEFFEGGYQDIVHWIEFNMIDLAFIGKSAAGSLPFIPLYQDEIVCVVPENFDMPSSGAISSMKDLNDFPLIIQEDGEDIETREVINKFNFSLEHPNFQIEDDNCILAMVEAGLGVAFMGTLAVNKCIANVKTISFSPRAFRTIGLYIPNESKMSPAAVKMRDLITDYVSAFTSPDTSETC